MNWLTFLSNRLWNSAMSHYLLMKILLLVKIKRIYVGFHLYILLPRVHKGWWWGWIHYNPSLFSKGHSLIAVCFVMVYGALWRTTATSLCSTQGWEWKFQDLFCLLFITCPLYTRRWKKSWCAILRDYQPRSRKEDV